MILSPAIRISIGLAAAAMWVGALALARDDAEDLIRAGKRAASDGRVAEAESSFARAAGMAGGSTRAEALFLQAGLTRSGAAAEALYRRLLEGEPDGEWAERGALELAKIQFATGRYETARELLRQSGASSLSDEACLFEGMASVMLHDYEEAIPVLDRVKRGRARTWAVLSLAEAEDGAGRSAEACRRYESLARARVSPTAWYRHAECLEKEGDASAARREYEALVEAFAQTPEAVRAGEKLALSEAGRTPPPTPPDEASEAPKGAGYTVQFGSFADRANAIKLAAKIKKLHPAVRIDSELVNYREVFRVRIGHYATREAAQSAGEGMARDLDERFTIMPVSPTPND